MLLQNKLYIYIYILIIINPILGEPHKQLLIDGLTGFGGVLNEWVTDMLSNHTDVKEIIKVSYHPVHSISHVSRLISAVDLTPFYRVLLVVLPPGLKLKTWSC